MAHNQRRFGFPSFRETEDDRTAKKFVALRFSFDYQYSYRHIWTLAKSGDFSKNDLQLIIFTPQNRKQTSNMQNYFKLIQRTETYYIYVWFYIKAKRVAFSTNISVDKKSYYDTKTGTVSSKDKDFKNKNLVLANIRARIIDVFVNFRLQNENPSRELFMKEYNHPSDYSNFYLFFNEYSQRIRFTIEESTMQRHREAMAVMREYAPELRFSDITEDFINNFKGWMRTCKGYQESTLNKKLGFIKKYVLAAYNQGFMKVNPFMNVRVKKVRSTSFSFLTEDELTSLICYYRSDDCPPSEKRVIRFFLFMCFGSQHVGDAKNTKIEDIYDDKLHYYRMKLRHSKPQMIFIPLSQPLAAIIDEVKGDRKKGKLFTDLPSDQKINEHLKTIAKKAKIPKAITCKTGRHTFATLYLKNTHDLASLKELLGHSDLKETMIYAHVLDETKVEGVSCFDKFI